jgi:hypothetical protein
MGDRVGMSKQPHARPIHYYPDMDIATLFLLVEAALALIVMLVWWGNLG